MQDQPVFSVIICSHKPDRAAAIRAQYEALFGRAAAEIIIIPDAKSLCEGYNRGFAQSSGSLAVFSHDDIEFCGNDIPAKIAEHLQTHDLIGVAGTSLLANGAWVSTGDPHAYAALAYPDGMDGHVLVKACGRGGMVVANIQALDGCFFAAKRALVEALPFDEATFDGFHLYDLDFSFRAHLAGYKVAVARDLVPIHSSGGKPDLAWEDYRLLFEKKFSDQLVQAASNQVRAAQVRYSRASFKTFLADGGPERLIRSLG
jgi:Glycosyltransferase like family